MENGNGDPPPPLNQLALAPNVVVTPENYWQHLQQIQRVKEGLTQYERDLHAGYQRYLQQDQELRMRIEAGRQAERMLAQLQSTGNVTVSAPNNHARVQGYPSMPDVQNTAAASSSASTSPTLQTFPPTNAYHNPQMQSSMLAYQQSPIPTVVVPYGQGQAAPPYQQPGQYSHNWPHYVNQTNLQNQRAGQSQAQPGAPQPQQHVPSAQPQNAVNGAGRAHPASYSSRQQQHASQPGASGSGGHAPAESSQRAAPEEIKRAKTTYGQQSQQQEQVASASAAYRNVYSILKELRPEMVDYIIFAALDSMRNKLPFGAVTGQTAFQKVRDQLPAHSVEQLSQISTYIVQQLQALEAGAIKAIVVKIKQNMMQMSQGPVPLSQTAAAAALAAASGSIGGRVASVQASTQAGSITAKSHPTVINVPAASTRNEPSHQPASVASTLLPRGPPSPPSLAAALGNAKDARNEHPTRPQQGAPVQLHAQGGDTSTTSGTSLQHRAYEAPNTNQFRHYRVSNTPPMRRTVLPVPRAQDPVTAPLAAPTAPVSSASSRAIETEGEPEGKRPKSPWTPAKADKARLARDIMQSLGRPSTNTNLQPPASSSKESLTNESANKRKRTPSVTDSPTLQKKQKMGMEVEEIATDGAFELAVWQQATQQNSETPAPQSEAGSPHKPRPAEVTTESIPLPAPTEERPVVTPGTSADVNGLANVATTVGGTISAPEQFPSLGAYLDMHLSQPTDLDRLGLSEQPMKPTEQQVGTSPRTPGSAASAPPMSRTTTPHPEPPHDTEQAGAGPSTMKTPLFFPSPTSEHAEQEMGEVSELQEPDPAEVFATAYSANAQLRDSPPRIPSRLKGKSRLQMAIESDDEDNGFVTWRTSVKDKQGTGSASGVERQSTKKRGRKIIRKNDSDFEVLDEGQSSSGGGSRNVGHPIDNRAFVLVPPLPEWAKQLHAHEKQKSVKRKGRKPSTPETVPESMDELAMDDEVDETKLQEERAQQEVVRLSITRLHESPCLWRGCDAILNSTEKLMQHVHLHVENVTAFACEWTDCTREFGSRTVLAHHLAWHASTPMFCSFVGCVKSFATAKDLFRHHKSGRHRDERFKPSTTPFAHDAPVALPPLPAVLPAYMQIPRLVTRHRISKVVHHWLSAKVLEDISSFRFAGRRMHQNAPSRGSRRLADKVAAVEQEGQTPAAKVELLRRITLDEYDRVTEGRALKAAMRCEDIPSTEVTRLCEMGLVLFPPPGMEARLEPKSEPEDGDQDIGQGYGDLEQHDTPVSERAVHEDDGGPQVDASRGGAGPSSAPGDTAGPSTDGDVEEVDGQHAEASTSRVQKSPSMPVWEVLPQAVTPPASEVLPQTASRKTSTRPANDCTVS